MKIQPFKFIKAIIAYIKSLGWSKPDVKKILMFIIMLLIACFILNNFLRIRINTDGKNGLQSRTVLQRL